MVRKMTKIRDVLLTQQRELEKFDQKPYVPRDIELAHLDKDMIKVIIGPRRAGKPCTLRSYLKILSKGTISGQLNPWMTCPGF